jgi:hypothetical protein
MHFYLHEFGNKLETNAVPVLDNWLVVLVWYTDGYRLSVNT